MIMMEIHLLRVITPAVKVLIYCYVIVALNVRNILISLTQSLIKETTANMAEFEVTHHFHIFLLILL